MSALKQLKIILGNIRKDALNNIIMFVFVTFAVFLMDISLSRFMHWGYINNVVRDSGLYEDYMYVNDPHFGEKGDFEFRDRLWEYEMTELDRLKAEGVIEDWFMTKDGNAPLSDDWENDRAEHVFYPSGLAVDLHFPVSKGIWFDRYDFGNSDNDVIPVVVGSGLARRFKVGSKITLPYSTRPEKEHLVIGVLERNAMILNCGAGGTDMTVDSLFKQGNGAIIIIEDKIHETSRGIHGSAVVKVSRENRQAVFDAFGDYSRTFTFEYMAENAYEENRTITEMQSIIFVLMTVVCIAGVSSANLLGTIASKKKYAVYFMCGMDWKTGVVTTLLESVLKLILPAIAGYAMFIHWCEDHLYDGLRVTSVNVIVTAFFLAAIFLLTSLMPLLDIRRTSPVKIIVDT